MVNLTMISPNIGSVNTLEKPASRHYLRVILFKATGLMQEGNNPVADLLELPKLALQEGH